MPPSMVTYLVQIFLLFGLLDFLVEAAPNPQVSPAPGPSGSSSFWVANIQRQGAVPFTSNASNYQIYRNVKDFGAKGDGSTDDTDAINLAISTGNRCGLGCDSATVTPAIVYFPAGTYVVSKPIIEYYYTHMIGDATNLPVLKAAPSFAGIAVIDSDPYTNSGANWYTDTNNFFRSVRNFIIDLTALPQSSGAGIHWQVAQASSLQNIRFELVRGGGAANKQQGIFMDNGSGGFMTDLVFNGGNYAMFVGNQQFTTRNLTFNDCGTAIFMNWNWAWTFKSVTVNNCGTALNISNSPTNQSVGSVLLLDSTISTTSNAIITAFSSNSVPAGAGTLVLDNVDFTNSKVAVAGIDGSTILPGGSVISSWLEGNSYTPSGGMPKRSLTLDDLQPRQGYSCPVTQVYAVTVGSPANQITATPVRLQTSINPNIPRPPPTTASVPLIGTSSTCASTPVSKARIQGPSASQAKPNVLLDSHGNVFERSKPQYETYAASSFVSIRSAGAKGDGFTDDTAAIQKALGSVNGDQILYIDHGAYIITSTLKIPKDIKIVGEIWPVFMASGTGFGDEKNPIPMFQVGQPGDTGTVEISDIILETKGPAPGAILMQWNVAGSAQGSAGIWDVHIRVGGSAGTDLQSDRCAKNGNINHSDPNPMCIGAFLLFHVTQNASVYVENSWFWVADHELDLPDHSQIDIYNGRGVLIESQNAVWMWGTSSEHSQLYNYQVSNSRNVFMALIQTETPYYQSNPNALKPFVPQPNWSDPDFSTCTTDSCRKAWGLRVLGSSAVFVYGAGLYSFFDNYNQDCVTSETCQDNIVQVDCSQVSLYALSTKASVNMVTAADGKPLVPQSDNRSSFCSTIALFKQGSP